MPKTNNNKINASGHGINVDSKNYELFDTISYIDGLFCFILSATFFLMGGLTALVSSVILWNRARELQLFSGQPLRHPPMF